MMKASLLGLILAFSAGPVWAKQATCAQIQGDLQSIEGHLLRSKLNNCSAITPTQIGLTSLTPEQTTLFENSRCKNLTVIDEELARSESRLLVSDGLKELRSMTVDRQNFLENFNLSDSDKNNTVTQFSRDVALGAMIQDFINPENGVVQDLLQTEGPDWNAKISNLCVRSEFAAKPFCQTVAEHPDDAVYSEFTQFLNTLSAENTDQNSLTAYNELLKLQNNGQDSSYFDLWQSMRNNQFDNFLRIETGQETPRPTAAQMRIIRGFNLAVPGANANPFIKTLVERMIRNSDQLETRGQTDILRQTMVDNADRHMARAKSRWSQVWNNLNPGETTPCMDQTGAAFRACVNGSSTNMNLNTDLRAILESVENGAQLAEDTLSSVASCLEPTRLSALINQSTPSVAPCSQIGLGDVIADESNRIVLMALRNQMAQQENTWLQYREYALQEANRCSFDVATTPISPACMGLTTQISVQPLLTLSLDSLQIIDNGLRSATALEVSRDCSTIPSELQPICSRIQQPEPAAKNEVSDDPRPAAVRVNPVQAHSRNRAMEAVIIQDAVGSALQNVTNSYFNNRLATQNFANQFAQPLWGSPTTGAYTYPVYGLSNYIMAYGRSQLGYGLYYNNYTCPNCNYTPPTNLFNATYGLGSSSSTFPSTYFGGASSANLASSFSF